ncbi:uncharacterized protein LAESUDRAFT_59374 [Laetiporus sulphureus 93-53]|uniref:Secreted protein n=1 Tax=Laetiporus sulphureus 93-53 TaxID=1314785 RepID=A0A165AYJ6_9APHY|nr:uncharacterized protein LAESUDRAFT_59374 [Laetiporus sulphureus 93-53]KZS99900.1 hypothetical protein LAESUDRAFT_59374 [Laetiporus sulphureus 93-53]
MFLHGAWRLLRNLASICVPFLTQCPANGQGIPVMKHGRRSELLPIFCLPVCGCRQTRSLINGDWFWTQDAHFKTEVPESSDGGRRLVGDEAVRCRTLKIFTHRPSCFVVCFLGTSGKALMSAAVTNG